MSAILPCFSEYQNGGSRAGNLGRFTKVLTHAQSSVLFALPSSFLGVHIFNRFTGWVYHPQAERKTLLQAPPLFYRKLSEFLLWPVRPFIVLLFIPADVSSVGCCLDVFP